MNNHLKKDLGTQQHSIKPKNQVDNNNFQSLQNNKKIEKITNMINNNQE